MQQTADPKTPTLFWISLTVNPHTQTIFLYDNRPTFALYLFVSFLSSSRSLQNGDTQQNHKIVFRISQSYHAFSHPDIGIMPLTPTAPTHPTDFMYDTKL